MRERERDRDTEAESHMGRHREADKQRDIDVERRKDGDKDKQRDMERETEKIQTVCIGGHNSQKTLIEFGIPQGMCWAQLFSPFTLCCHWLLSAGSIPYNAVFMEMTLNCISI